jgi:hypothetical protein
MQELCVVLMVLYAMWSMLRRYAPKAFLYALGQWCAIMVKAMGMARLAALVEQKSLSLLVPAAGGCQSGCSSCKGCGSTPQRSLPAGKRMIILKEMKG